MKEKAWMVVGPGGGMRSIWKSEWKAKGNCREKMFNERVVRIWVKINLDEAMLEIISHEYRRKD